MEAATRFEIGRMYLYLQEWFQFESDSFVGRSGLFPNFYDPRRIVVFLDDNLRHAVRLKIVPLNFRQK